MGSSFRRGPDPLEQGLDRLVSAGRQFVDGVSGARPGGRPQARGAGRRSESLPRLDGLGRWVEGRLDWLLDDDGEDSWREPWQQSGEPPQPPEVAAPASPPPARRVSPERSTGGRRSLEAISRRALRPDSGFEAQPSASVPPGTVPPAIPPAAAAPAPPTVGAGDDWPDEASFSLNRWQRPVRSRAPDPLQVPPPSGGPEGGNGAAPGGRPLPRSTRRR